MKHQVENGQGPRERGVTRTRESLLGGGASWVCAPAHLTFLFQPAELERHRSSLMSISKL